MFLFAILLFALAPSCHGFHGYGDSSGFLLPFSVNELTNTPKKSENTFSSFTSSDGFPASKKPPNIFNPFTSSGGFLSSKKTVPLTSPNHGDDSGRSLVSEQTTVDEATKTLEQKIANLTEKNSRLKYQVRNLNDVISDLNSKRASQGSQCKVVKGMLKKATAAMAGLKKEKKDLVAKLAQAEAKLKTSGSKSTHVIAEGCPKTFTDDKGAGICYGVMSNHFNNYEQSQKYCKTNFGGRLAVLNTNAKFRAVQNKIRRGDYSNSFWVGSHAGQDGRMKWSDGSNIDSSVWAPGEPNSSKEKCGDMHWRLSFRMNDESCSQGNLFVCEVLM